MLLFLSNYFLFKLIYPDFLLVSQTSNRKRICPACRVHRHREVIQIHPVRDRFDGIPRRGSPEDRGKAVKTPA